MKENIEKISQEKNLLKEYGNGKKNMEIKLWNNLQD
jgi:hypothetical protein